DVGAGSGELINDLRDVGRLPFAVGRGEWSANGQRPTASFIGIERGQSLADLPPAGARLVISNELFDAQPFARLVCRGAALRELTVVERDGRLDWSERDADPRHINYFADRG